MPDGSSVRITRLSLAGTSVAAIARLRTGREERMSVVECVVRALSGR